MNVSICILNWEAESLTVCCLKQLLQLKEIEGHADNISIIVVDNNSQDGSDYSIHKFIENSSYEKIHFLRNTTNSGYAAGNNLAIRYALEHLSPDFVWILNNDTLPTADSLSQLLEAAKKQPSVAIFGSTLLDENGSVVECAGGSYYSPCLSTYKHALKGLTIEEAVHAELPKPLDYIEGAAMFVRAEVFRTIGLLNEEYFLYFEELDLVRRLPSDSHIDWCKKSFVRHIGGASMESKVAEYHSNLSALIYTRKYHPYCFPFMAVFRFMAKLFRNILTGRWSLNEALVSSYKHYFLSR